jgi:hypothetical protein
MYHKVKNTLAGLSMVALFIGGGLLFSEPVAGGPARDLAPAAAPARADGEQLLVVLARAGSQVRLQAGIPYYSFGALIPRRQES